MTSISALPPVTSVLPNAAEAENNLRALTTSPDFQSQLKDQSKPPLLPPSPSSAQVLSESTANLSRRPDVEALLQLLAWRKNTFNVPSKIARSVPGAGAEMINLTPADEHSTVLCPEPIEDPAAWRADSCGSDFIAEFPYGGGLNAAAIAVALSGSTLIWTPFETVRAPLQSPRIRIWRRRKPHSVEGQPPDQSGSDVDNNHG